MGEMFSGYEHTIDTDIGAHHWKNVNIKNHLNSDGKWWKIIDLIQSDWT